MRYELTKDAARSYKIGVDEIKGHDIARMLLPYATTSRTHQYSKVKHEQREANARLIACAPDMFQCLHACVAVMRHGSKSDMCEHIESIQALIARITDGDR